MNKTFRTLWNPTLGNWVAAPETARGHARTARSGDLRAVALAVVLLGAGPAFAAGGAGGQPSDAPAARGGAGGGTDAGGLGGINDTSFGGHAGDGGSSSPVTGATAGAAANPGAFPGPDTPTAGTGGAAGVGNTLIVPGTLVGSSGNAGQAQTGGPGAGDGYGGGGGGGATGFPLPIGSTASGGSYTGGSGGAGGDGYWAGGGGGAGGYGSTLVDALSANYIANGNSTGGVGGKGGDAFSQGGGGGSGGGGFYLSPTVAGRTFTNTGTIAGGAGGAGGAQIQPARTNASGGGGGAGGNGITLAGNTVTVVNTGSVTGGAGGAGGAGGGGLGGGLPGLFGAPGAGGDGGAGLASTGNGATINNSGAITGGAGGVGGASSNPASAAGANGAGGVGILGANLAISNSSVINGGLGGDGVTRASAVEFTGGANSLTLTTGSKMLGAIAIDGGATGSVIAGSNGLSVDNALLLGGTGTIDTGANNLAWSGPISGAADLVKQGSGVLTLSGANLNTGATSIAAGTLRAGAANTLSAASAVTVASGAKLDLAGFSQSVAGVTNSGTVSLVGSAPGTTLTVTGPWIGNGGTLALGTALGTSASATDRLILSGSTAIASGTTNVAITNLGGLGALTTGNGIEIISAINGATTTAQTTRSAFALTGGHVDAGAYQYRLFAADAAGAGENWYLRSSIVVTPPGGGTTGGGTTGGGTTGGGTTAGGTGGGIVIPTYRSEVPLYAALPEQLRQANLSMLGNMHQRVGDDGVSGANTASPEQGYRQAWARIISTDRTISQAGTVSPTSQGRLNGFQAGTDLWADPHWRAGVYVGQLDGTLSVSGFASGIQNFAAGSNDLRNQYFGAYGTWKNDDGFYVDGVLQAGRHRYSVSPTLSLGSSGKGSSLLASIEVGQAFHITPQWVVEPQLQLVHQRISLDDAAIYGATVQQNAHSGWLARAGVRVKGDITTGAGLLQPYVRVNVYRAGGGSDIARFIGPAAFTDIATRTGGTSSELAAGATLQLTPTVALYGEVGKLWASSGDARNKSSIDGSVGVKFRW